MILSRCCYKSSIYFPSLGTKGFPNYANNVTYLKPAMRASASSPRNAGCEGPPCQSLNLQIFSTQELEKNWDIMRKILLLCHRLAVWYSDSFCCATCNAFITHTTSFSGLGHRNRSYGGNKQWLHCREWQFFIAYMFQKWPSWFLKLVIANFPFFFFFWCIILLLIIQWGSK